MKRYTKLLFVLPVLFSFVSCGETEPTEVSFGYDIVYSDLPQVEYPSDYVKLAAKVKTMQNLNVQIDISFGCMEEFELVWSQDLYEKYKNKNNYCFAIEEQFKDSEDRVISCNYELIYDFPDINKYIVTETSFSAEKIEQEYPIVGTYNFQNNCKKEFDFSILENPKGKIYVNFVLFDIINNKVYTDGINSNTSWGLPFNFYEGSGFNYEILKNKNVKFSLLH